MTAALRLPDEAASALRVLALCASPTRLTGEDRRVAEALLHDDLLYLVGAAADVYHLTGSGRRALARLSAPVDAPALAAAIVAAERAKSLPRRPAWPVRRPCPDCLAPSIGTGAPCETCDGLHVRETYVFAEELTDEELDALPFADRCDALIEREGAEPARPARPAARRAR